MIDNVIAIHRCIEQRKLLQGMRGRFHKEGHEAQFHAVGLFEYVFVFIAHGNHWAHIDFIEGGQYRIVGL